MTAALNLNKYEGTSNLSDSDVGLFLALETLKGCWWKNDVGVVAACLLTVHHAPICATSLLQDDGKWIHAERNVLDIASETGIKIDDASILAVSLSPCVSSQSKSRAGDSCTDLILNNGIRKVHFGIQDPAQQIFENTDDTLTLTRTMSAPLYTACQNLLRLLEDLSLGRRTNLNQTKTAYGDHVFQPLVELTK